MLNDNMEVQFLQDVKNDKEIDWKGKKLKSLKLSEIYRRLGEAFPSMSKKSDLVAECGSFLGFKRFSDGTFKLGEANFCKVRLCPMCAWRRSLKIYGQVSKIMDKLQENNEYRFIFLTLTCKNVKGHELEQRIKDLMYGFKKLMLKPSIKKVVKGWFRALEVTHDIEPIITKDMYEHRKAYYKNKGINIGDNNPNYNTFHPHFHIIFAVNKSYFKKPEQYIKHSDFRQIWKECMGFDYLPIVNVQAFKVSLDKEQTRKSIAEVAKYTVKDSDFLTDDNAMNEYSVGILDNALHSKRLIAFGGDFKKLHKELNLGDALDGDLVNTDNEDIREDLAYTIERYAWNIGYKNYSKL